MPNALFYHHRGSGFQYRISVRISVKCGALNLPWNVLPWEFLSFIAPGLAGAQAVQYHICADNENAMYYY